MKNASCEVIRDLLPLYEDGAASEESQALVRRHLADCPECREELRKMRTPVSVPPEEDEALWERFRERQNSLRRRRNIRLGCCLGVLAAAVLFTVWYTWPRGWNSLTGPVSGEITSMSSALCTARYSVDEDGKTDMGFDFWLMQGEQAQGAPAEAVTGAFRRFSYRKSLQSLIPRDSWSGTADYVQTGIIWDAAEYKSFHVSSDGRVLCGEDLYYTDRALYHELAQIVREYGTKEE